MHNANFDLTATEKILEFANCGYRLIWDWDGVDDSCIASHVLENLWSHSLKELRAIFLLVDDSKQEALRVATNHARRIVRTKAFQEKHGVWRIADANDPHWPAVSKAPKEKSKDISGWWHMDTWLPRTIALKAPEFLPKEKEDVNRSTERDTRSLPGRSKPSSKPMPSLTSERCSDREITQSTKYPESSDTRPAERHSWFTVLRDYAIEDSETTLVLWETLEREIRKVNLWDQYLERKKLIKTTHNMERVGVTVTPKIHTEHSRYLETAKRNEKAATTIAQSSNRQVEYRIPPNNSIFVFGSNREGRHGAGSAQCAHQHHQAIYGQAEGLQGNSYGIITKELRKNKPPVTLEEVKKGVSKFLKFAESHPGLNFKVVEVGCMLAGFTPRQIGPLFQGFPDNVYPPKAFIKEIINQKAPTQLKTEVNIRSDKQLQSILYKDLKLPILERTSTGQPSVKAEVLKKLYDKTDDKEISSLLRHILLSRNNEKAASYLTGYRGWLIDNTIHSGMNITGTKFTRQSSSQPNLTNVGTGKELEDKSIDYNLRECFGPEKFWKWLSFDYSNIELRIWGYDCGNKEFIYCFENDISVHYLVCCELHPGFETEFSYDNPAHKEDKRYKRTKNGNFAIIYGASPHKANATYNVPGAFEVLSRRFPEVRSFTDKLFEQVSRRGWIETMTGYRLHIPKNNPHVAVSGRVQGTAGAIIGRAMNDCTEELENHPQFMTKLILQIHDELVFKCPLKTNYKEQITSSIFRNMEKQGESISIPLPVGGKEHQVDWSKGISIER